MSANLSLSIARTEPDRHARFGLLLVAVAALVTGREALAQEPVAAVWKAREVDFMYRSSTVLFPCHELQNRVAVILRAVGARDDIQVKASDCDQFLGSDNSFGREDPFERRDSGDPFESRDPFETDRFRNRRGEREQTAIVRVQLMTPVEVTPAVLAEIERDKSRRELVSRVTRNPAAARNDPVVFAAKRQSVTLSRSTIRLEPKDCQLLEQMSRSVFRELDMRVVRGTPSCGQASRMAPQVTVEALMLSGPLMQMPPASTQSQPAPSAPTPAEPGPAEPATATKPE